MEGKKISFLEDCKMYREVLFLQEDKTFWKDGITKLPEKQQKVVEQNGEYVVQCQKQNEYVVSFSW